MLSSSKLLLALFAFTALISAQLPPVDGLIPLGLGTTQIILLVENCVPIAGPIVKEVIPTTTTTRRPHGPHSEDSGPFVIIIGNGPSTDADNVFTVQSLAEAQTLLQQVTAGKKCSITVSAQ